MDRDEGPERRSAKLIDELRVQMASVMRQEERTRDLIRQSEELVRRSRELSKRVEATIGATKRITGEE
jgi:hypothetical protein